MPSPFFSRSSLPRFSSSHARIIPGRSAPSARPAYHHACPSTPGCARQGHDSGPRSNPEHQCSAAGDDRGARPSSSGHRLLGAAEHGRAACSGPCPSSGPGILCGCCSAATTACRFVAAASEPVGCYRLAEGWSRRTERPGRSACRRSLYEPMGGFGVAEAFGSSRTSRSSRCSGQPTGDSARELAARSCTSAARGLTACPSTTGRLSARSGAASGTIYHGDSGWSCTDRLLRAVEHY